MVLADGKDDRLADFAADRVAQSMFHECLAQKQIGWVREESFFKLALFVGFLVILAFIVFEFDDEAFLGKQSCCHFGAGVHHRRVDQEALLHPIEQGVAEGRLAVLTAKGAISVEQQTAFGLARVAGTRFRSVKPPQVIARGGGEPQLVANEVVEYCAGIAANGAVRFIRNDEIEVGRREELLILVVEEQGLDGGDDNLCVAPVIPALLVNHRLAVGGEQCHKSFPGLVFQFETIHQEQHAPGVSRTKKKLDDCGGSQGLAGAGGHLEQETITAFLECGLEAMDRLELIGPEKAQLVGLDISGALRFVPPPGFRLIVRPLGKSDVVRPHLLVDQALRIGRDLLVANDRIGRWK